MKRRNLILLLGGASSGAMSVGTGAFSSMEAERGVEVNVVNDGSAFVGYKTPADDEETGHPDPSDPVRVESGNRTKLVTVLNRFADGTDIGVVGVDIDGKATDVISDVEIKIVPSDQSGAAEEVIQVGDTDYAVNEPKRTFSGAGHAEISALVSEGSYGEFGIKVTIEVKGTGIAARLFGDTRAFTLDVVDPQPNIDNVIFEGGGNAEVHPDVGTVNVEARFSGGEGSGPDTVTGLSWDTSKKLNKALSGKDTDGDLLAVRFPDTEDVFINPEKSELGDDRLPSYWDNQRLGTTRGDYQSGSPGSS